jgi:hypothetical protein
VVKHLLVIILLKLNMKKYFKYSIFIAILSFVILIPNGHKVLASPSIAESETVANVDIATIPSIVFAGGADAATASTTITIPASLAASATDQSITIDGVVIALGASAQTATQIATTIKNTSFAAGTVYATKPYTVTSNGADVKFTRNATGSSGNGALAIGDANYTTTNEVKATRTLTVSTAVASSTAGTAPVQLTVGTCVVTFATTTAGTAHLNGVALTADEPDCTDLAATILLATSSNDIALTVNQTAQELRGLKNVSDTGHGALTVGGSSATVTLTTTGAETSATTVNAALSTGSAINLLTVNTAGVILVTSTVPSITLSGGVTAAKATASVTVPAGLPASATQQTINIDGVSINLGSAVKTAAEVADEIVYQLTGGVDGAYTLATSTPTVVVFTRSSNGVAGDGTLAMSDATYSGKARVVTFTPSSPVTRYTYTVNINGTDYSYDFTDGSLGLRGLVEGIKGALGSSPSVTCTEDHTAITCTAVTPGTTFTSSASVAADAATHASAVGGSHGGGGGGSRVVAQTAPVVTTVSAHGVLTAAQIQSIRNQIAGLLILIQRLQQKLMMMRGY